MATNDIRSQKAIAKLKWSGMYYKDKVECNAKLVYEVSKLCRMGTTTPELKHKKNREPLSNKGLGVYLMEKVLGVNPKPFL